jgi:26S proteasome regulatory subunit N7
LSSFQLVKIDAFAASFGVSNQFIEQDVSNLISAGRLDAKIDLVQNVIKVVHSTNKMSQFVDVVNQADGIVSKINTLTQRAKAL